MAPSHSRLSARPSRGPQDVVFLTATQKVRPAVDSMLAMLRDSAEGLRAAAEGGCSRTSETAVRLSRATLTGVADVLTSCEAAVRGMFQSKRRPLHEPLPIAFVLWILKLLYCAFVFAYMPAAGLAFNSPASLVFHALIFLILASFARAAATDPGGVPHTAEWRTEGAPPPGIRERKRGTGEARWCRREECYKPDRAHHSSVMGRTVLRMDHHCMWMGNTIGFRNHKFFFLFLLYANAACSYFGLSILELLVHATLPALSTFLLMGAGGLAFILLAVLGPFFAFHCWLLFRNTTTVEFMEGHRPQAAAGTAGEDKEKEEAGQTVAGSPYDLGLFHNISSVLGENPLTWLLPIGGPAGDGLRFRRVDDPQPGKDQDADSIVVATGSKEGFTGPLLAKYRASLEYALLGGPVSPSDEEPGEGGQRPEPDPEEGASAREPDPEEEASLREPDPEQDVASSQALEGSSGWAWSSASSFVGDLGEGFRALGDAFAQTAAETSGHLCSLGILGTANEQKARRTSWVHLARRSVEAAAPSTPQDAQDALLPEKVKAAGSLA